MIFAFYFPKTAYYLALEKTIKDSWDWVIANPEQIPFW
jgi:hypothetical protein